jgi:hypothetical protein
MFSIPNPLVRGSSFKFYFVNLEALVGVRQRGSEITFFKSSSRVKRGHTLFWQTPPAKSFGMIALEEKVDILDGFMFLV